MRTIITTCAVGFCAIVSLGAQVAWADVAADMKEAEGLYKAGQYAQTEQAYLKVIKEADPANAADSEAVFKARRRLPALYLATDRLPQAEAAVRQLLTGYAEESIRREPSGSPSGHPAKRLLRRLLENMDEANRQVVFLRFEVGLTHEEIAEICGVSRVAITKRLAKFQAGLAPFKDSLRQDLDEAGFAAQSQMAVRQAKDVEDC